MLIIPDKYTAVILLIGIGISFFSALGYAIFHNPFKFPYYSKNFDVSGKRNPTFEKLIDEFINQGGFDEINTHQAVIEKWIEKNSKKAENSLFPIMRKKQYRETLDSRAYYFTMTRNKTKYTQKNKVKTSYVVSECVNRTQFAYDELLERYEKLKEIGFEATLLDYQSRNQRRLMTKELRRQIMERDGYTCQKCGKYMPDEVGLQIDHILPVAKGGKSVPSNLQVLCSKCNGRKSDKNT